MSNIIYMNNKFKDILSRIQLQYHHKSDAETARFLGIRPQTLNNWKQTASPDYNIIFEKCTAIDLHWLITGKRAPSSNEYSDDERMKRSEIKTRVADYLLQKAMAFSSGESLSVTKEEIQLIRDITEFL